MQNDKRKEFYQNYVVADKCANCHSENNLQVHHIVPLAVGGTNNQSNFVTLCGDCHGKIHGNHRGTNWKELQKAGIERAKAEGKYKGGKPKEIDMDLLKIYIQQIENQEITKVKVASILNISRPTLDKYIKQCKIC